ncbi:chemotaxis-specific protein-glutamate methyltransferase CheB [bacterium]|nr:chemotaxis-specific protein-glutamate methyltransferase CheB [bacterium]
MIVDDSAVARGLVRRWLTEAAGVEVAAVCADGEQAVREAASSAPDVILLDVEMPKMDGLAALPLLRKAAPQARIVMASALTQKGGQIAMRAMTLGAVDCIAKPEASRMGGADAYRDELVAKIVGLGPSGPPRAPGAPPAPSTSYSLRGPSRTAGVKPRALLVASSTGGPQALVSFLTPIARRIEAPILIVQHMPPTFTTILAEKLGQTTGRRCIEPKDGQMIQSGEIYLAPGDWHMRLAASAAGPCFRLDQGAPVNFCRPAADPMFASAVDVLAGRVVAVVLTGMGSDGRAGAQRVVDAGGRVGVQDEASSVVWGMPGAVATAGLAEVVKPLSELATWTLAAMNGGAG